MIGDEIRKERLRKGLSQERLAFEAGIHPTYVSLLERGLSSPTVYVFVRISDALGVKPWTLLGRCKICEAATRRTESRVQRVAIHIGSKSGGKPPSARATASKSCRSSKKSRST